MKHRSKDLHDRATDLKEQLAPHVESAVAKAGPALADAREKAAPVIADARDKAAPYVAGAREKAAPYVADAKGKWTAEVLPALSAAAAAADHATADYREEAMRRGAATAAALKGEVEAPVKKKGRKRKVLLVLGLGGLAFAAVRKFMSQDSQAWETSYQPTPAAPAPSSPSSPAATSAPAGADTAAATPGEAMADATDEPHPATDPDQPASSVDIDDDGAKS